MFTLTAVELSVPPHSVARDHHVLSTMRRRDPPPRTAPLRSALLLGHGRPFLPGAVRRQLRTEGLLRWSCSMPLDVLVEVDAERLGAQCQEDDADNDIHRFE